MLHADLRPDGLVWNEQQELGGWGGWRRGIYKYFVFICIWFCFFILTIQSYSLEHEYKMKLPSYEECMMAEPCKVKLDVEIHKAAAEKNMITM